MPAAIGDRVAGDAAFSPAPAPMPVLRAAEDRYEIFAPRSFALSVWEWLADAALAFGYDIGPP